MISAVLNLRPFGYSPRLARSKSSRNGCEVSFCDGARSKISPAMIAYSSITPAIVSRITRE
jgi:hypothetical protein